MTAPRPATRAWVGEDVLPVDWAARTDGSARYTADLPGEGILVAGVARSPHPCADVVSADRAAAERVPGVRCVLLAEDFPRGYLDLGGPLSDRHPLARGRVRHVGEQVAAVAADDAEALARGLAALDVRYRVRRPVLTTAEAVRASAPAVHDHVERNVAARLDRRYGAQEARRRAPARARGRYWSGRHVHACLEPQAVRASWDAGEGVLHVWAPTQSPANLRRELAHVLGLEPAQVRLREIATGGDFGARVKISDIEVLAGALSMRTGRPVAMSLAREDEFANNKYRHPFEVDVELGADRDGRMSWLGARIAVDNGAYNHAGPSDMNYGSIAIASLYRLRGAFVQGRCIYTNKRSGGSFRGAGGPQTNFALESAVDELAESLGRDPLRFRIDNATRPGDVTVTGWRIGGARLTECLETVREALAWDERRTVEPDGHGLGVAAAVHVTGALLGPGAMDASAVVEVDADGRVRLRSGCSDPGTGQKTVLAQIAASELGLAPEAVAVSTGDTAVNPPDPGAGASRGTFVSGNAARGAARAAAERLRGLAAGKFAAHPDDVVLDGGQARHGDDRIPVGDLVALDPDASQGVVAVRFDHETGMAVAGEASGIGDLAPSYAFAAQGVEVAVDEGTGRVRVLRVVAAHDSGTIINPVGARGQVVGGVVMALGAALGEELLHEGGRVVNPGFVDYAMPRAADAPPVDVRFVEEPDARGPYGAKGLAEISLTPTAAALANAVSNAIGVRLRELPLTPDKVVEALRERDGRSWSFGVWKRPDRWWVAGMRWAYPRGLHHLLHTYGTRLRAHPPAQAVEVLERPREAGEAVALLRPDDARCVGGGTDLAVTMRQGLARPRTLVGLTSCASLTRVTQEPDGSLSVGAAVTLAALAGHAEQARLPVLRATVERIATPQIRELATVGGNLAQEKRCWFYRHGFDCYKRGGVTCPCYAVEGDHRFYHAVLGAHRCQAVTPSDLATTLLALDARVRTLGVDGAREVDLAALYTGPGELDLRGGEIIASVRLPAAALRRVAAFDKLTLWEGDFAVVSACASVERDAHGRVADARVALGGVAATPYRARLVERELIGRVPDGRDLARAARAWERSAHPLTGNAWKVHAASSLVARCLVRACGPAERRPTA